MENKLFIDVDQTVNAFNEFVVEILGATPEEYIAANKIKNFWKALMRYRDGDSGFFDSIPVAEDAHILINATRHVGPTFLTGCPMGNWAPDQKIRWARKHFPDIPIITCMAVDKCLYMEEGDILIDDNEKHRSKWEDAGGIWITHTSAEESLRQLEAIRPEWVRR